MSQREIKVLDSNVFIEPKNRYYPFDLCPGYWDFLIADFNDGKAVSILPVKDELKAHKDELADWVEKVVPEVHFYNCMKNNAVVTKQRKIAEYVHQAYQKPNVVEDFLKPGVADSWVLAYALVHNATLVTHETHKSMRKKVSLYDLCKVFGVECIDVFTFLRQDGARFEYNHASRGNHLSGLNQSESLG